MEDDAALQRAELASVVPDASPPCPSCGNTLVIRLARRGFSAGNEFWGCSSWPSCSYSVPLESHTVSKGDFQSYARG